MRRLLKKSLALLLALTMVFGAAPLAGLVGLELPKFNLFCTKAEAATYSGTCGKNLTWTLDDETGVLTVNGTGDMYNWETSSDVPWCDYRSSIKTLVIDNGVTSIGDYAFKYCVGLTNVIISDSVTNIGYSAFENCTGLTSITIPNSVTRIDWYAFYNCTGLTSVTIPDSVTSIGSSAFENCAGLTSVTIPDSVTSIGDYAFYNCTGLKGITIPDSVTRIGSSAFYNTGIYNDSTYWENDVLYIGNYLIEAKTTISGNYTIKTGTKVLADYAFYDCTGLTSITIPDSVTSIDYRAFYGCTGLTSITIPDSVTSIGDWVFEGCTGLTNVTIPDSVKSIGDSAFKYCTSLKDVYYSGTEEQWNAIGIGSDNSCLTNANIHYNSSGEISVNPEIEADETETPTDRTAYQGVFEDYVTAVVINGNGNWVSDIIVDGNKYHVKKDLISFSEADACLNKDVIFVVKDGEVVYFSKSEYITVKTVLGLSGDNTLNYGYLGDNSFSKNSIKLGLRIHNLIAAPAPADFVSSEEQKKNLAAIGKLESLKVYISNVTLTSDPENIFNFSGKKSVQIPVDRYLSAGGTLTTEVPVNVNSKYKPKEYKYHACIAGKLAFKKGEVSDTSESNFYITVCNYNLDPNKPTKNNSTTSDENNQLAKKAASELNKVQSGSNQGAISLTGSADLVELIGFKNIKAIEEKLFAIICLTHIPKEKIEETLSDKVISKVFGAKKWFCLNTKEIQLEVAVNTKYGEIVLKLTSEYPEYNFNGYNLGGLGQVEYELSGKGAKKLPKDFPKTGCAGFFTSVDVTAFCNAAYSFVESELKKSYKVAYGNDVNKAVDFIFGKSVNKILKYTKYGSVSGLVWEALTVAGKEYKIECPVDVYVYDSAGNLVASIENNVETLSCENVEIEINGDTKYVRLFDDSYKIVYKATANGSMRVTVNEMANLDTSLRTVVIDDIPLSAGVSYTQNSDEKILEDSNYALTANDGTVYNPNSDTVNFHDHISNGVWYDGDASTCTEKGWKCSICTVCNEWFKEYLDMAAHTDNDGNGYCDDCGVITAVSGFAIRKPSTATINYGDAIILHADIDGTLPEGARIEWTADNGNFSMSVSADGTACKISPKSNGKTVFTATVYDKDGNVISSDTQEMTAKAGLWQKIVAFFKKIFGLTKTFPEAFKGIF